MKLFFWNLMSGLLLQVYNELVCNCHEDSMLLEVIELVEKVYTAQTQTERCKFGQTLQRRIRAFLEDFVRHMEEEEAIFQPLLDQNFEPQELKQMNEKVIEQHKFYREKIKEKKLKAVKRKLDDEPGPSNRLDLTFEALGVKKSYCQEVSEQLKTRREQSGVLSAKYIKTEGAPAKARPRATSPKITEPKSTIEALPEEVIMMIFSHLVPRDLLNASAVSKKWNRIALSSALWQAIYPTQWARGCWSLDYQSPDLEKDLKSAASSLSSSTESLPGSSSCSSSSPDEENADEFASTSKKEHLIFRGIVVHLLPKIGNSVSTLILSASRGITSKHIKGMLRQAPHVRLVDLSYTNVTCHAFTGLSRVGALRKLEELNMAGCKLVGDALLHQLSLCFRDSNRTSHLSKLTLSGCRMITSWGIVHLEVHQNSLQELDLSGCFKIDGLTLSTFVQDCPKLKAHRLSYCNDIEDGPYQDTANGCLNLECDVRFCCQNAKLRF